MRNPTEVLKNLMEKSKNETYRFQRLYRNLYNPEFYWLAYKNIYANDGSMTAGADGITIDGMGNERIERIILSLKDRSYQPKPARREYIAKKNSSKKRPLGIQSGDDKLVQEVVKMILESIYEPVFSNKSHGFRPNRSCQTALKQIQNTFTGANWFVEGDIHACFDSFDHHVVIDLLKKRIDDEAFIQLIWKFLKAGYMEQWTFNRTYSGVPQGSGVSPVLANIYLHELDKFMENYAENFNTEAKKKQIQNTFTGANWFVEGDIHACFDSFDHHVVIDLLKKRIDDEAFIQLIWKFLKAGYMEQWTFNRTYSGVPQGSGVSPVLANIYLHELDKFMENYAENFNTEAKKKHFSTAYKSSVGKAYRYRKKGREIWDSLSDEEKKIRCKNLKELEMIEKSTTPYVYNDSNYKRVQYTRYADDFIIGVIGSKADAEAIKKDVKIFLQKALKLEMSDTKTKVTHTGDRARFLGYDITVSRVQTLQKASNGRVQRCQTGVVKLYVPREKWVGKLIEYKAMKIKINENGKERFVALHRGKLVNQSDIEILARYNAEVRGLYNYYSIANDSFKIGRFANVMKYSMYKTFACKYKTNVHEIKRRYCRNELFTVAYETRQGMKTTTFYRDGYKRKECATKFDNVSELPQFSKYAKTNTLKQRVERHTCELCQKDCRNLVIHQVKKLKDLKGNTEWVLLMRKRRRKTLVVCPECHNLIHS